MTSPTLSSRLRGAFHALAVTDALGAPVEFKPRGTFPLVTTMLPNNNFLLFNSETRQDEAIPAGSFTDDTSMALCLATSLLDCSGKHDSVGQVRNYLKWMREGYMSSVGECFDIGNATSSALKEWGALLRKYDDERVASAGPGLEGRDHEREKQIEDKVTSRFYREDRCGNGSLMRVLPVGLLNLPLQEKLDLASQTSIPTHPHKRCRDACVLYTILVSKALAGTKKEELALEFHEMLSQPDANGEHIDPVLHERLSLYTSVASWQAKPASKISSSGYVVDSLEASLWAFFTSSTYRDGAIKVVNLGDDADTVGAIYGGLAGAYYGEEEIPREWSTRMRGMELVDAVVGRVWEEHGLGTG